MSEQPCAAATSALAKAMGGKYLYACSYASRIIYGYQVDGNGMLTQKSVTQTGGISDGMVAVDLA